MFIKKIELQGFKSFYKRTKIEFHPGVTAIVGPNGCGKSNLVDGIIWALGEGRLRALKGERVGEIIFNGSEKREQAGMAEVSLWVEDDTWEEPLSIGRILYRSGESEFRINGKKVRLKDVQDELWKRGLGGKDYFVIEQGSIGAIISYKPSEKRALIEEAVGIVKYKERKKEAKQKLEAARQNLIRIEDIIQETEKQKNSLQRQASLSRKYRNLRERLRDLSILFFYLKLKELTSKFEEINLKIADSELTERSLKDRLLALEGKIRERRETFSAFENEIIEKREGLFLKKTNFEKEKANYEKEEKRKSLLLKNIEDSGREIFRIEKELEEWDLQEKKGYEELVKNKEGKEKSLKRIEEVEKILSIENNSFQELQKILADLKRELSNSINMNSDFSNQLKGLEREMDSIKKSKERLSLEREKYLEVLKKEWIEEELSSLKASLDFLIKEIENLKEKTDKIKEEIKNLEKEIRIDEIKKEEILLRLKSLSKNEESIEGVYGILKDFLEIEKKYIKGAEIIWEKELSSFVVKDREKVISMIKDGKLKGNFIFPTDKEYEENFPNSLSAEIKLEEKISLPPIMIVNTIEEALELLKKYPNYNFITPEGLSITSFGVLSTPMEKGELTLKEEFQALKQELEIISEALRIKSALLHTKKVELSSLEEGKKSNEKEIEKIRKKISELEIERSLTEKEKKRAGENLKKIERELESLEKDEIKLSEEKDKLKNLLAEITEKIPLFKEKLRPLEEEFTSKEKMLSRLKEELTYEKGMLSIFDKREKDIIRNLENMKNRRENLSEKLNELKENIISQKREAEDILAKSEIIADFLKREEAEIIRAEAELKEKESMQSRLKEEIESLENDYDLLKKSHEEKKDRRNSFEIERAEIKRDLLNIEERVWNETSLTLKELEEKAKGKEISNFEEISGEVEKLKREIEKFGPVNLLAEQELEEVKQRLDFLKSQRDDIRNSIESIQEAIEKIDEESRSLFMQAFEEIKENFKKTFSMLFEGGDADLRLQDLDNPLETGVEIYAQPPGKRLLNLNLLSGGEKALTSLAFLFALFLFKPSPFCVFDEVDAPLDDANLGRFLKFIEQMKPFTQFIIITHNPKTIEKADYIYGISMNEPGVSTVYSMKLYNNNKTQNYVKTT